MNKTAFDNLALALQIAIRCPDQFGGVILRARAGPMMDRLRSHLSQNFHRAARVHGAMDRTALVGGIDPIATLQQGVLVRTLGILRSAAWLNIPMAERAPTALVHSLTSHIDANCCPAVILWDEGIDEEAVSASLADRCAFYFDLTDQVRLDGELCLHDLPNDLPLHRVQISDDQITALVAVASRGGITSLRLPQFAVRFAKLLALVDGRSVTCDTDIETAVLTILAPRMVEIPMPDRDAAPSEQPQPQDDAANDDCDDTASDDLAPLLDMMIAAVQANLPKNLLEQSLGRTGSGRANAGAGKRQRSNTLGRPKPSRVGKPGYGKRIDVLATLRAAAPWQKIRRSARPDATAKFIIYPSDIHVKQYEVPSERVVIFGVDASGSAALARFAEAKGAIEIMLADAYAKRDYVALVGFRGQTAEVLLQPTRSLVMAKKTLAAFAGGGGTPLAMGMKCALDMAQKSKRDGRTPTLAFLTDGKANIALDGSANRDAAMTDVHQLAGMTNHLGVQSIFIDVGRRPNAKLQQVAATSGSQYLPLPLADARAVSNVIRDSMVD